MPGLDDIERPRLSAQIRIDKVIEELKKRGVTNDRCSRCGVFDWSVDFLGIPASPLLLRPAIAPQPGVVNAYLNFGQQVPPGVIPVVCLVCKNCGYTLFHNLNILEANGTK